MLNCQYTSQSYITASPGKVNALHISPTNDIKEVSDIFILNVSVPYTQFYYEIE